MLLQLSIKNFALIEEISFDLDKGFNILSGETGAGKSILIDAIDYVLGGKFSKDLIRTGEERTSVEAIFQIDNCNLKDILDVYEIEYEDTLIIRRETLLSGKSIVKVNGKALIVSQLKKIGEKLLDIHGQHQNGALLDRSTHINYLDDYIGQEIKEILEKFKFEMEKYASIKGEIDKLRKSVDSEKMIDYIKFQLEDIEKANLKLGEEEDLKLQYEILNNSEKINKSLNISYDLLNGTSNSENVLSALSKIISELNSIDVNHSDIKEKRNIIEEAFYNIEEATRDIRSIADSIQYDEGLLADINERLFAINSYKKKYGGSVEAVLSTYKSLKKQYDDVTNSEEILKELNEKLENTFKKMKTIGDRLTKIRLKNKGELEKKILNELAYVGLNKSQMIIEVENTNNFNENGFDIVTFMISTNPGEPVKSLEKVLSGGELSRIMLAFKCVFADKDRIPTLIFDEIDTGISGQVGQSVGEKMYQVSINHQVLCITHLPQIAILSDNHYFVSKNVKNGKTFTSIRLLNKKEKILQVASMLGGDNPTETTISNVEEMLSKSESKKSQIKSNIGT
ncbi:DNA repair protein RecN [Clostridium chrysemydis]|uniref:DNA repair protein RecN n=1 Tax=Clostridium chrysemydis TaxID=2665504 RepID=UPI003F3E40B6